MTMVDTLLTTPCRPLSVIFEKMKPKRSACECGAGAIQNSVCSTDRVPSCPPTLTMATLTMVPHFPAPSCNLSDGKRRSPWLQVAWTVSNRSAALTHLGAVGRQLSGSLLYSAFAAWHGHVGHQRQLDLVCARALRRIKHAASHRAFASWRDRVQVRDT